MKVQFSVRLIAETSATTWNENDLRDALAKAGFVYALDRHVKAQALRDGCEAFLDKETDEGVIALYEIADLAASALPESVLFIHAVQ